MKYLLFFLSLYLSAIETLQVIQPFEEDVTNDLTIRIANCANAIGKRYFFQTQNVEIISPKRVDGFQDFGIVIRSTYEFEYPDFREMITKHAIVFLENIDYEEDLKMLSSLARSHPQGRFIVSVGGEVDASNWRESKRLNRIIIYLASIERWNVVILANDVGNRGIRLYTFTVYTSGNCKRIPRLVDSGSCDGVITLNSLFPAFVNFHKCPVRLTTTTRAGTNAGIFEKDGKMDTLGIESNVVKLIMGKLNATFDVFEEFNGSTIRYAVQTRKVDIAFSYMLQNEVVGSTWTQSFIFVQSLLVIPQSRLMPSWMNLILPFRPEVWATLGMTICIHLVIKLLIPPVRTQFHLEWMLLGFFGVAISKLPTRISQRLYVAYWIIVGYIVTQCYLASLTGFFASPGLYKPVQTLGELDVDKSGIVVGGMQPMKPQFQFTNPGIFRNFKILSEPEYYDNIKTLKLRRSGIAVYAPREVIMNITKDQETYFMVIPQPIAVFPIALLLPNSSPILEGCNQVIYHVCEAGLIQFWEQCFARETNNGWLPKNENYIQKTSLAHLRAVFLCLGIGLSISCAVFAIEVILARYRT